MNWAQSGATSITFCRSHESVPLGSAMSGLFFDMGLPLVCKQLPASQSDVAVLQLTCQTTMTTSVTVATCCSGYTRASRGSLISPNAVRCRMHDPIQPLTWTFAPVGADISSRACEQAEMTGTSSSGGVPTPRTEASPPTGPWSMGPCVRSLSRLGYPPDCSGASPQTCRARL